MRGDRWDHTSTGIGALTRADRYREAAFTRKIDDAYRGVATTSSRRRRRRHLRTARRHERALLAQRRRPQSALFALAFVLLVALVATVATGAGPTVALVVAGLFAIDVFTLRRRRRLHRA